MTVKIAAFVMIQIYATKNVKLTEKISKFMTLLQKNHTGKFVSFHEKEYSCGSWGCCNEKKKNHPGCKKQYTCCGNYDMNSIGCKLECVKCKKTDKMSGCIGKCKNCDKKMTEPCCISYGEHSWIG